MQKTLILLVFSVVLSGCASMQEMSQRECAALNLKAGTPEFANCYQQAMMRRQSVINAGMDDD